MISKSSYTLVGAFVLVLSAAFIWGVMWISAGGTPRDFNRYLIYMPESVSGLNVDAAIKYRGVEVGKVEQISIDQVSAPRSTGTNGSPPSSSSATSASSRSATGTIRTSP